MKEIPISQKVKVIKLFLSGGTYGEIGQQVGVAKGSVVNIVDEFREGYLSLPPGMTDYIDELRKLVVDMKKHDTTVSQVKNYVKLHAKLKEMGVNSEQVDKWLDLCQDIATSTVTTNQFVKAALELAQLTSSNGLSYADVITGYNLKLDTSIKLDKDIEQKKEELSHLKSQYKDEKQQATETLNSINKAIATAQDAFQKQKNELKSQLDEYMTQNKLTWDKINTVCAILTSVLVNAGLNQKNVEKVSGDIATAGSLLVYIQQLKQELQKLEPRVEQLAQQKEGLTSNISKLGHTESKVFDSILEKGQEEKELDAKLGVKRAKLVELEQIVSGYIDDIRNVYVIIGFLISPEYLSDNDIDELVRLMIHLRQYRLGIGPQQVKDGGGNVVCECKVPKLYTNLNEYEIDEDEARKKLALYLAPLVKDKFMPRWEYNSVQLAQITNSLQELQMKTYDLS